MQRGAIGRLADDRFRVDRAAADQDKLVDSLDMARGVDELELSLGRGRGLAPLPAQPVLPGQCLLDRQQSLRRVRVLGHLLPRIVLQARRMAEVQPRLLDWSRAPLLAHQPSSPVAP